MTKFEKTGRKGNSKHKRFRNMNCYNEFHSRVMQGYALTEIASWLQEEMQECTDIAYDSLVTLITRYRKDLSPVEVKTHMTPEIVKKAEEELAEGLDELNELQSLYKLQLERINMGHKFEKMTNVLNKMLGGEISRAGDLLMRHHNLKMDLGFNGGRNLGSLTVRPELELEILNAHGAGAHKASKSVEAGSRVLSIAKALTDLEMITDAEFEDIIDS